jgi:hypothetical protein
MSGKWVVAMFVVVQRHITALYRMRTLSFIDADTPGAWIVYQSNG